jgi:drug/metabolite transporter (DMT)-like permease
MSMRKAGGIALGFAGVVVVSGLWKGGSARASIPALLACVAATACYGLAGVYLKRRAKDIEPKAIAAASQLLAGLLIAPAVLAAPPREVPSGATIAIAVVFALLCSALAYLIYYRLIASVGPTKTLTVTFLMPVFGLAWGALFLGESVTVAMLVGAAVILGGTYLVTAREGGSSSRGAAGK